MSTLNEFIASVKESGLMRTNRFLVEFNLMGDSRLIQLYCDAVNLPGLTLSTQQARTFGEFREMPYERLFENVNFTFYVDNDMSVKLMFDNWMKSIINPVTRAINYYDNYTTDITVYVLDTEDNSKYYVKLYECYPKSIAAIQMDHSAKDVMKLNVSMNYRYWTSGSSAETAEADPVQNAVESLQTDPGNSPTTPAVASPYSYGYNGPVAPDYRGGYVPGSTNVPTGGGYDPTTGVNQSDSANSIGGSRAIT